jgi:hypothetical protein
MVILAKIPYKPSTCMAFCVFADAIHEEKVKNLHYFAIFVTIKGYFL